MNTMVLSYWGFHARRLLRYLPPVLRWVGRTLYTMLRVAVSIVILVRFFKGMGK